jgi:hypothetical protein
MKIILEAKRGPPIIRVRLFKRRRREVKVDPKLGGQWNVPSLMAIEMFHAWWPMECSKLDGHCNVPCLVANGMFQAWWPLEGEGKTFFTSSIFLQQLYLHPHFFPFDLTILLYHGPKPFSFSSIYKLWLCTST